MAETRTEVDGFREMQRALRDAPQTTVPYLRRGMLRALNIIHGIVRKYPPESEANRPTGRGVWYERNFGLRWRLKSGGLGGRRTSEQLGKNWNSRINVYMQGVRGFNGPVVEGVEGNRVSYAPLVQSRREQTRYHRLRGWIMIEDAVAKAVPGIHAEFADAVDMWIQAEWEG